MESSCSMALLDVCVCVCVGMDKKYLSVCGLLCWYMYTTSRVRGGSVKNWSLSSIGPFEEKRPLSLITVQFVFCICFSLIKNSLAENFSWADWYVGSREMLKKGMWTNWDVLMFNLLSNFVVIARLLKCQGKGWESIYFIQFYSGSMIQRFDFCWIPMQQ